MLANQPDKRTTVLFIALAVSAVTLTSGCGGPSTPEPDQDVSQHNPIPELSPQDATAPTEPAADELLPARDEPATTTEGDTTATPDEAAIGDTPDMTTPVTPAEPPIVATDEPTLLPDPPGLQRLSPEYNLWIDPVNKEVVMVAEVVLREGGLELFACLRNTKEHEAIIAVDTEAWLVHTGLLAVGAQKGAPVAFRPEYKKASGSRVEILLRWKDPESGEPRTARAQDWIRNAETGKAMQAHWVFGGSSFWEDDAANQRYYLAEDGDLICVANFHSAMLDVPIESTQSNDLLMYDAYTQQIPPIGTEVWVRLKPVLDDTVVE